MPAVENFVIFHQTVDLDLFRVVLSRQLLWELKGVILPKRLQSKQTLKVDLFSTSSCLWCVIVAHLCLWHICVCGTCVFVTHLSLWHICVCDSFVFAAHVSLCQIWEIALTVNRIIPWWESVSVTTGDPAFGCDREYIENRSCLAVRGRDEIEKGLRGSRRCLLPSNQSINDYHAHPLWSLSWMTNHIIMIKF